MTEIKSRLNIPNAHKKKTLEQPLYFVNEIRLIAFTDLDFSFIFMIS